MSGQKLRRLVRLPDRGERRKSRKRVRIASGISERYFKGKASKHKCGLCGSLLHGVPHGMRRFGVSALSRSERRPTAPFGGMLCGQCRAMVFEEAAKVKHAGKGMADVEMRARQYVEAAMARVG